MVDPLTLAPIVGPLSSTKVRVHPMELIKQSSEAQEQKALFAWAKYHPICKDYLIAIPNGGSRHATEARNLKMQGVKAGVSDIFLAYPKYRHVDGKGSFRTEIISAGLWIELKRRGKHIITPLQRDWIAKMKALGYQARFCIGWEEAKKAIEEYLGGEEDSEGI
jgi:hypothetical protein